MENFERFLPGNIFNIWLKLLSLLTYPTFMLWNQNGWNEIFVLQKRARNEKRKLEERKKSVLELKKCPLMEVMFLNRILCLLFYYFFFLFLSGCLCYECWVKKVAYYITVQYWLLINWLIITVSSFLKLAGISPPLCILRIRSFVYWLH